MLTLRNLDWLTGFLEGEGSFSLHSSVKSGWISPRLDAGTTDRDVIERAARTLETKVYGPYKIANGKKPYYRVFVHGSLAAGWMMTLFSLMGKRRQGRIREVLLRWRKQPSGTLRDKTGRYARKEAQR